jgi:hypothetical protein
MLNTPKICTHFGIEGEYLTIKNYELTFYRGGVFAVYSE